MNKKEIVEDIKRSIEEWKENDEKRMREEMEEKIEDMKRRYEVMKESEVWIVERLSDEDGYGYWEGKYS